MKPLEEMTSDELADFISGRLIMAIGGNRFRAEVFLWMTNMRRIGYEHGLREGKKLRKERP